MHSPTSSILFGAHKKNFHSSQIGIEIYLTKNLYINHNSDLNKVRPIPIIIIHQAAIFVLIGSETFSSTKLNYLL